LTNYMFNNILLNERNDLEMQNNKEKVALVTGSGKGIGRGIAIELAKAGYNVGVHYGSSLDGAREVAKQIEDMGRKAVIVKANIQKVDEIRSMFDAFFKEFDHIDLLVNNAGITRMVPFLEVEEDLWEEVVNTDFKGAFFCSQMAARNMVENKIKGVIINITSNHTIGCWPNATIYGPVKAALTKFTKNLALDLAPHQIRVVAIAPGYTELEWFTDRHNRYIKEVSKKIPLQRFANPKEIGEAVVYLASEKAGYITGTSLLMDGGALLPVVPHNDYSG
jgi:NAD(P)-dependent dehydrogenase (short-subunit alcohol dehydrogenase family)